mmetsp:Transcript_34198/g.72822  ORF Transcript_34198/g.72822 Transcript_34198/m.72822 type:complete len:109 (-) Transcript_34198:46-372(-)
MRRNFDQSCCSVEGWRASELAQKHPLAVFLSTVLVLCFFRHLRSLLAVNDVQNPFLIPAQLEVEGEGTAVRRPPFSAPTCEGNTRQRCLMAMCTFSALELHLSWMFWA